MKKRILRVLLATTIVVSLIGCGAKEEVVSKDTTEEVVEEIAETEVEETIEEVVAEPVAVEITMDNWEEYFVLEAAYDLFENSFGEYDNIHLGKAFCLRQEYAEKFVTDSEEYKSKVGFELQYTTEHRKVTIDPVSGTYEIGEETYFTDAEITDTDEQPLTDYRNISTSGIVRSYGENIASVFLDNRVLTTNDYGDLNYVWKDCEVLRAEGTLYLYE